MPTVNYPDVRYKALDKCLGNHNRKFFMEDLVAACNKALRPYERAVSSRTVRDDLDTIEIHHQILIDKIYDGHRVYYRYSEPGFSIYKKALSNEDIDRLKEAVAMLGKLKGLPNFEWIEECITHIEDQSLANIYTTSESVVSFQQNPKLRGLEFFTPIFQAIVKRQPLAVLYEPYGKPYEEWIIHPYYLKQFNNRWYLIGKNHPKSELSHVAVDRIVKIKEAMVGYVEKPLNFDFERDYFSQIYGVTMPKNQPICHVKMQFDELRWPYIESKPIHQSQKTIGERTIQIEVKPNKELEALILSYGNQCTVLEPSWFKDEIKNKLIAAIENY